MSKTIYDGEDFSLTQFWGGADKGISIQITQKGYVQFNKKELKKLMKKLNNWLDKQNDT